MEETFNGKSKKKTTLGMVFWMFLVMGCVVSSLSELIGEFLIIIALALGIIWIFRRVKKSK